MPSETGLRLSPTAVDAKRRAAHSVGAALPTDQPSCQAPKGSATVAAVMHDGSRMDLPPANAYLRVGFVAKANVTANSRVTGTVSTLVLLASAGGESPRLTRVADAFDHYGGVMSVEVALDQDSAARVSVRCGDTPFATDPEYRATTAASEIKLTGALPLLPTSEGATTVRQGTLHPTAPPKLHDVLAALKDACGQSTAVAAASPWRMHLVVERGRCHGELVIPLSVDLGGATDEVLSLQRSLQLPAAIWPRLRRALADPGDQLWRPLGGPCLDGKRTYSRYGLRFTEVCMDPLRVDVTSGEMTVNFKSACPDLNSRASVWLRCALCTRRDVVKVTVEVAATGEPGSARLRHGVAAIAATTTAVNQFTLANRTSRL